MQLRTPAIACSLLSVVWLTACPHPLEGGAARGSAGPAHKAGRGEPIAKIGETVLTTGDLEDRLNQQSPFVRARYATDERKQEFLDNQVRFEVLAKEAFRRGYDQDPEVVDSLKKILVQKLTREEFDGRVNLKDITDQEIQAYYDSHSDDYNKPEMVRTSHILIPFGADKVAAKNTADEAQRAASAADKLEDREHFKTLVTKYSQDEATKRTGGDLRYLSAQEIEERFGAAAKDAVWTTEKINDVTGVVEGKDGYHVFKRTGRRKPIERSLEQVRNQIRNVLYREKRTEAFGSFVDGLQKEFGVQVFPERLGDVKVEQGGASPMPIGDAHGHGHGMGAGDGAADPDDAPATGDLPPDGDPR